MSGTLDLQPLALLLGKAFVIRNLLYNGRDFAAEERMQLLWGGLSIFDGIVQERGCQDRRVRNPRFCCENGRE
jgi:hypothetical protein